MNRMMEWTEDMIRFMVDASENSTYFDDLAKTIVMLVGNDCRRICDAGCGLGQLSLALGAMCGGTVDGVDISHSAISVFTESIAKSGLGNVNAIETDMLSYRPAEKYDLVVFNYFGSMEEIVDVARRAGCGKIVVVKRDYPNHRFSFSENPILSFNGNGAREFLKQHNIDFRELEFSHEFGQPFRSFADAMLFFKIYSRDSDTSLVNERNVLRRLEKTADPVFPYYMRHIKKSRIFLLEKPETYKSDLCHQAQ